MAAGSDETKGEAPSLSQAGKGNCHLSSLTAV
jgi:hypothetical protein